MYQKKQLQRTLCAHIALVAKTNFKPALGRSSDTTAPSISKLSDETHGAGTSRDWRALASFGQLSYSEDRVTKKMASEKHRLRGGSRNSAALRPLLESKTSKPSKSHGPTLSEALAVTAIRTLPRDEQSHR
ncbi:hypothetical protein ACJJTC_016394 [Scirpophaga incertulas]